MTRKNFAKMVASFRNRLGKYLNEEKKYIGPIKTEKFGTIQSLHLVWTKSFGGTGGISVKHEDEIQEGFAILYDRQEVEHEILGDNEQRLTLDDTKEIFETAAKFIPAKQAQLNKLNKLENILKETRSEINSSGDIETIQKVFENTRKMLNRALK